MRTCIHGGTLITAEDSRAADLWLDGDTILGACDHGGRDFGEPDRAVDASGRLVVPGGVDVHTHLDMPVGDIVSADDFETGTRAAAFGGTTAIIDYIGHARGQSLRENLDSWRTRAERAVIDYGFHQTIADAPPSVLDEMAALVDQGITSFKVFLAYPGRLLLDDPSILRVLRRAGELGALANVHAEAGPALDVLIEEALARGQTDPVVHALTRPEVAEATGTERAIALAEIAATPVYIVHVSCRRALERIEEAQRRGRPVLGETCPQYLFLDQDALRGTPEDPFAGAKFVCTPPLRPADNQAHLWRGIATGSLTVVATDHCPFNYVGHKDRGRGDFSRIPNGLPGIETRVPLLWEAVEHCTITPGQLVDLTATAPAKIFGLYPRKGSLEPGADADVVIWDRSRPMRLDHDALHMRVDHSIYEGRRAPASPVAVFARGELVVDGGTWLGRRGRGRFLERSRYAA